MPKVLRHWTKEEQQIFFKCMKAYGNDFYSYTYHLNRTHSQIKSHYHNWQKQHQSSTNIVFHKQSPGGNHVKFRSYKQFKQLTSLPFYEYQEVTANSVILK
ncbi:Myb domain [Hexamita inflata]|uniref:Myb domain n=1 Tax=Hexamita inflata TaxID=28002 RepID=A0AA86P3P4_9EUKA|nr:Myb domain [Hexamita inflata]CAI9931697.1 Myb domain [Hexamita inflata]CAI9931702.1 Myb domain [Hexamita inflata]